MELAMIRYVPSEMLHEYPVLASTMFKDRAAQFKHRLEWSVSVDQNGWEVDQYDSLNPTYVLWENSDGTHGGSLRLMPTTGRTMAAEHFSHLTDGVRICSPLIWEITRFCLSPGAPSQVASALVAAATEFGLRFGIEQAICVVYTRTLGIYRRIGHAPDVIGTDGEGRDRISICIGDVSEEVRDRVAKRAGLPPSVIAYWFDRSFYAPPAADVPAAPELAAA
jgi:acyl homoserine lactone synthase